MASGSLAPGRSPGPMRSLALFASGVADFDALAITSIIAA